MSMKKFVKEHLDEDWVSSDTGAENYLDYFPKKQQSQLDQDPRMMSMASDDIKTLLPPTTMKLSPEEFEDYIKKKASVNSIARGESFQVFRK